MTTIVRPNKRLADLESDRELISRSLVLYEQVLTRDEWMEAVVPPAGFVLSTAAFLGVVLCL